MDRHSRQSGFAPIGVAGQQRLRAARVLVVGVGALGSSIAEQLARAGVGRLRLVDRDVVDLSNLQRQCLYAEADADGATPKVVAAARRLAAIDASLVIEPIVAQVSSANIARLVADCDVVCDGGDNFAVRHLVNEACCAAGIPWIYAACVGAYACSLPVDPGRTPCLRCLQDELPAAGDGPTCDSVGIIMPAVLQAAAWSAAAAMQSIVQGRGSLRPQLLAADLWSGERRELQVDGARDPACRACGPNADRPSLQAAPEAAVALCGRNGWQFQRGAVNLSRLAARLGPLVDRHNDHLLRCHAEGLEVTIFHDGRVLVVGDTDELRTRAAIDRLLG